MFPYVCCLPGKRERVRGKRANRLRDDTLAAAIESCTVLTVLDSIYNIEKLAEDISAYFVVPVCWVI